MICPNCESNIPDDSRYCPDCGSPVLDIDTLVDIVKKIIKYNTKGFNYFVEHKSIPYNIADFTIEDCEKIIAMKGEIMKKNLEILQQEQRKREKEKRKLEERLKKEEERKKEEQRKKEEKRRIEEAKTYIDGHEYVDLGLPSKTKWATCNIGANTPQAFGNFYSWGETKTKKDYSPRTSKYGGLVVFWLKFRRIVDSNGNLTSNYDVATQLWGSSWHMPTLNQIKELIDNTTQSWIKQNGLNGMLVTSKKNGKSIFLPAAGVYKGTTRNDEKTHGHYLGSTIDSINHASSIHFYQSSFYTVNGFCDDGYTVRPVSNS